MNATISRILAGAIAGAVATAAMTPVIRPRLTRRAPSPGRLREFPPRRIIQRFEDALPRRLEPTTATETTLTWIAHLGYGLAVGAAFGLAAPRLPAAPPLVAGVAWGTGVWIAGYAGWVPLMGIREGTIAGPRRAIPYTLASHLVFGAALDATHRALDGAFHTP
jgi:hypothetical protein